MEKSKEWCEKSARQGFVHAQIALGKVHEAGIGGAKDGETAVYWYQKAAEQGNAEAQYRLAITLIHEKDWEDNIGQVVSWLEKASAQGYEKAKASEGTYRELCDLMEKAKRGRCRFADKNGRSV